MKKCGGKVELQRVLITVPKNLLKHFDSQIKGAYTSRSEAIRHGMKLLLDDLEEN
jgi:metal-responsive CopG/Arc/MetJ family transcriptional regulator